MTLCSWLVFFGVLGVIWGFTAPKHPKDIPKDSSPPLPTINGEVVIISPYKERDCDIPKGHRNGPSQSKAIEQRRQFNFDWFRDVD